MQRVRTWIPLLCAVCWLIGWSGYVLAQNYPSTGAEPGLVTYTIKPLPPVSEVSTPGELLTPAGPALAGAEGVTPQAEEIAPPAAEDDTAAEKPAVDGDGEKLDELKTDAEVPVEDQSLWYFWRMWEVGYELGVSGSAGNTDTHTWRTAVRAKRTTDTSVLTSSVDYKKSMDQSTTTADRLYSEWRAEFPNKENKWSWYMHGTVEFDAFRAYDARVTEDNGIGYQWYKTDVGSFITRIGAGTSREFGGPNDEWVPEGVMGAVYERQLTKKQKLAFSNEFFFDWTNFGENRMNSKADWEVTLDEEAHLSLKVSVINRYDSTPDGKQPNDVDYSTVLLWSF